MKDQIKIAVITVLIFVSGVLTGIWTQHTKTPPPPPFGRLPEFGGSPLERPAERRPFNAKPGKRDFMPPRDMKEMREKMEKLKPKMEEFKKKFETIKEKNKTKIIEILNKEQKAKFDEIQAKRDQMISQAQDGKPRIGFGKAGISPMVEHFEFLSTIIYKPLLERLTQDLKLDDMQKKSVDAVLLQRRKEILDLLDSTPPPSLEIWNKKPGERRGLKHRPEFYSPQGLDNQAAPPSCPRFGAPQDTDNRQSPGDAPNPPPPPKN